MKAAFMGIPRVGRSTIAFLIGVFKYEIRASRGADMDRAARGMP
jgi:hypothetical protein